MVGGRDSVSTYYCRYGCTIICYVRVLVPTAKSLGSDSETVMLGVSSLGFTSAEFIVSVHSQQ